MVEKKIIEELAAPILEKLKEIESSIQNSSLTQIPQVHFIKPDNDEPLMIGSLEVDHQMLDALEIYLQDEIEKMAHPSILH